MVHTYNIRGTGPYNAQLLYGDVVLFTRAFSTASSAGYWALRIIDKLDANNKHLNPDNTNTYEEEWAQLTES